MSLIDQIVDIQIKRQTAAIAPSGLNNLLIIGESKRGFGVKSYDSMAEVVKDYPKTIKLEGEEAPIDTPENVAAGLYFGQSQKPKKIYIGQWDKGKTIEDSYYAIAQEVSDFYGVMTTMRGSVPQMTLAKIVEAESKLFGTATNSPDVLKDGDEVNLMHALKGLNYGRTFCIYNSEADKSFPEAAIFGLMFAKDAGSATWANKTLSGVKTDKLSTAQIKRIEDLNGNYYTEIAGRGMFLDGRTSSGDFIDIVQGLDWVKNNLQVKIINAFNSSDKIPLTNPGIAIIESMIRNGLAEGAARDIIDGETISVKAPTIADISLEDRAQRLVTFEVSFRLAGAIHKIKINVSVTI